MEPASLDTTAISLQNSSRHIKEAQIIKFPNLNLLKANSLSLYILDLHIL